MSKSTLSEKLFQQAVIDQKMWLAELGKAHSDVYLWRPSDWREIEEILR